ncbi:hypothetical protein ACQJBY_015603 [Aegilops geniculata]
MSSPSLPLSDPWRDPLPCTCSAGRTGAQPYSTTQPTRPIAATSPGCSPPRRGGAVTPRASLVAARTAIEEAVYEVVLRQAALVEDLQGRGAAWEAEAGRRRWRDEQLEQEGNAELGIQFGEIHGYLPFRVRFIPFEMRRRGAGLLHVSGQCLLGFNKEGTRPSHASCNKCRGNRRRLSQPGGCRALQPLVGGLRCEAWRLHHADDRPGDCDARGCRGGGPQCHCPEGGRVRVHRRLNFEPW